jgi:hypothetical protein
MKSVLLGITILLTACGMDGDVKSTEDQGANLSRHGRGRDDRCLADSRDGRSSDDQRADSDKRRGRGGHGRGHDDEGRDDRRGDVDCVGQNDGGAGNSGSANPTAETPPSSTALTYQDVEPIIRAACVKCHQPGASASFLPLDTQQRVESARGAMADAIASGFMPLRNPGFKDTADGQKLLSWLNAAIR